MCAHVCACACACVVVRCTVYGVRGGGGGVPMEGCARACHVCGCGCDPCTCVRPCVYMRVRGCTVCPWGWGCAHGMCARACHVCACGCAPCPCEVGMHAYIPPMNTDPSTDRHAPTAIASSVLRIVPYTALPRCACGPRVWVRVCVWARQQCHVAFALASAACTLKPAGVWWVVLNTQALATCVATTAAAGL